MYGAEDRMLPIHHATLFEELTAAPKKDLIPVEGVTHYIQGAAAEEYGEKIADWVNENMPCLRGQPCW